MVLELSVAVALAWLKTNAVALVSGFVARHLTPAALAKLEAAWVAVDAKVKAVVAWVKSKV